MVLDKHDLAVQTYFYMKTPKAMTVRLSPEQAEALETVATVEERPVSEIIRAAIAEHIESRRKDRAFQDSLAARIERARRFLTK
jgi:predicted transcriptional regulator